MFRFRALAIVLLCFAVKILLIPTYRSTDFEVHRNWLAITHSKPIREWYSDGASKSEWTLDYPPLFAWFEWGLSHIASYVDPKMLDLNSLNYASDECILFQRLSVIASELVLVAATWFATRGTPYSRRCMAMFLVMAHPGIMIVDNIHFQYNGMLLGLLLFAMSFLTFGNDVLATFVFTSLLCFKHIFLYVAPAFGVYYLGVLSELPVQRSVVLFVKLTVTAGLVLALSFGPFLYYGAGMNILGRLFPVQRGLVHAYWAPNFWALYAGTDKIASLVLQATGMVSSVGSGRANLTGGLVGEASFAVLPDVTSSMAALVTLAAMMPALISTFRNPLPGGFYRATVFCSLTAFMFGYHVHEKAILMTLVPLAILAARGRDTIAPQEYVFLTVLGTYGLFPLLTGPQEYLIKLALGGSYLLISVPWLRHPYFWKAIMTLPSPTKSSFSEASPLRNIPVVSSRTSPSSHGLLQSGSGNLSKHMRPYPGLIIVQPWQLIYLLLLPVVEIYCSFLHQRMFGSSWPFIPLMLISLYCGFGMFLCWVLMAKNYVVSLFGQAKTKTT